MDEKSPERRQQIIEAAFRVFSRKGFKSATNREIAKEAGITSGLLYWYFRNKEDLFRSVVETKSFLFPLHRLTDEMLEAPPREFFSRVGSLILGFYHSDALTAGMRLLFAEALRSRAVGELLKTRVINNGLERIALYIDYQIKRGTIRPMDPTVGARLFMGMLMSQVILGRLLEVESTVPIEKVVDNAVTIFLEGVSVAPGQQEKP